MFKCMVCYPRLSRKEQRAALRLAIESTLWDENEKELFKKEYISLGGKI